MERLSAVDLECVLRFLHEALAEPGPEPFPAHVVDRLRALLGCEWGSYCELDRRRRRALVVVESPVPESGIAEETFWRLADDHPLCQAQHRGRFDALMVSDFYSRRQLHRREFYADWLRLYGFEFELELGLPSPLDHTKTFLFDDGRRDFGERERTLLNLLQPHLSQLYRAAGARGRAAAACTLIEADLDLAQQAVLVVDRRGDVQVASERARRLLREYFGGWSAARVPADLLGWLDARAAAAPGNVPALFTAGGSSGTLMIESVQRGVHRVLLLQEHPTPSRAPRTLTPREREVLDLVATGMRNDEIAQALWVSPATVRKHLENTYEKLGVHTRTAAVAAIRRRSAPLRESEDHGAARGNNTPAHDVVNASR